jgi:hypothetical protein
MTGHHFVSIARSMSFAILASAALFFLWGDADKQRKGTVLPDGGIEFTLNSRAYFAWALVVAYLIYATVRRLIDFHSGWFNLYIAVMLGGLAVLIAFPFPAAILVTSDGLEQISWLWKNKRIRWKNIVEINTGEKSRTVTVTAADGTTIVHSRQLPDRERLLMEIQRYCGDNLPTDFPREPLPREPEKV